MCASRLADHRTCHGSVWRYGRVRDVIGKARWREHVIIAVASPPCHHSHDSKPRSVPSAHLPSCQSVDHQACTLSSKTLVRHTVVSLSLFNFPVRPRSLYWPSRDAQTCSTSSDSQQLGPAHVLAPAVAAILHDPIMVCCAGRKTLFKEVQSLSGPHGKRHGVPQRSAAR